jgi:hypothetical protein
MSACPASIIAEHIEPGHLQDTASRSRSLQDPPRGLLDEPYSVAEHDVTMPAITLSAVRPAEQAPSIILDIDDGVDADDSPAAEQCHRPRYVASSLRVFLVTRRKR